MTKPETLNTSTSKRLYHPPNLKFRYISIFLPIFHCFYVSLTLLESSGQKVKPQAILLICKENFHETNKREESNTNKQSCRWEFSRKINT